MSKVFGFSDTGATGEKTSGRSGAAIADMSQAGFQTPRGFIISTGAVRELLLKTEIQEPLASYVRESGGHGADRSQKDFIRSVIRNARLVWDSEMEVITRFKELDSLVAIRVSTTTGMKLDPVFAHSSSSLLSGISKAVGNWLVSCPPHDIEETIPALVVQEIVETEASIELKRKKDGFMARAVFGLPEGLFDPTISTDKYHFDPNLSLVKSEEREQSWQHIPGKAAIEKVDVMEGFREEPKVSEENLAALIEFMSYMMEKPQLTEVILGVLEENLFIIDARMEPEDSIKHTAIAERKASRSLISEIESLLPPAQSPSPAGQAVSAAPVVPVPEAAPTTSIPQKAMSTSTHTNKIKLLIKAENSGAAEAALTAMPDIGGLLLLGEDWPSPAGIRATLEEISRKSPNSEIIVRMRADETWARECLRAVAEMSQRGGKFSVLLPDSRTLAEHEAVMKIIKDILPHAPRMPDIWASVTYPSNLFFIERLAADVDVITADIKSLAIHLTGVGEDGGHRVRYDEKSLHDAVFQLISSVKAGGKRIGVHSPDFFSSPSLLEALIRHGADMLAVAPDEAELVDRIIKTLELKISAERM